MIPGSFLDSSACQLLFEQQNGKKISHSKISEGFFFLVFIFFLILSYQLWSNHIFLCLCFSSNELGYNPSWRKGQVNVLQQQGRAACLSFSSCGGARCHTAWQLRREWILYLRMLGSVLLGVFFVCFVAVSFPLTEIMLLLYQGPLQRGVVHM